MSKKIKNSVITLPALNFTQARYQIKSALPKATDLILSVSGKSEINSFKNDFAAVEKNVDFPAEKLSFQLEILSFQLKSEYFDLHECSA